MGEECMKWSSGRGDGEWVMGERGKGKGRGEGDG